MNPIPFPAVICLVMAWSFLATQLPALDTRRQIQGGHWKVSESFEDSDGEKNIIWAFELVDDGGSTLFAIGRRYEINGQEVKDRTVGILFIDRFDDGTLAGTLIEAYGTGKQNEFNLDIDSNVAGTEITMAAFDGEGSIISKYKAQWLGKGLKTRFKEGSWTIREIVSPGNGSWDIEWSYRFSESTGKISGKGNKAIVNGRNAYPGERKTFCSINLERLPENRNAVIGKGVETNHKGRKSHSSYEGWVSPSGRALFLMSYDSDGLAALLVGRYSGDS